MADTVLVADAAAIADAARSDVRVLLFITGDDELATVTVATTQNDPERAVLLVDTLGEQLLAHVDGQAEVRRQAQMDQLRERIAEREEQVLTLGQGPRTLGQGPRGERDENENARVALLRGEFAAATQRNASIAQLEQLQASSRTRAGLAAGESARRDENR